MLNEEYLEQIKPDTFDPTASKEDKSAKSVPLLDE
jgi:hypothetical protein